MRRLFQRNDDHNIKSAKLGDNVLDDDDDVGVEVEVGADVHVDVDVSQHGGLVLVFRGRCRLPVDHVRLPPLYCLYNYSNYKASTTPTSIFRAVSFAGPGKL